MTNWWPGLIALAVGLAGGLLALWLLRRGNDASAPADQTFQRLDAKVRGLTEQLKELTADRHLYDDAGFALEKNRLEQEAVAAMRARDDSKNRKPSPAPIRKERPAPKHPQLIGAAWGAGTVAFIAVAFFMLQASSEVKRVMPVANQNDPRYEALLILSAISLSQGDSEALLQAWELYMRQPVPRRRPPMLARAVEWLEKVTNEE